MAHYAELNENNEVIRVLYLDNDTITDENGDEIEFLGLHHLHKHHGADKKWIRTSYNGNFRGKYASRGDTYREDLDMFIGPQPYAGWILNEETGEWDPPIPYPDGGDRFTTNYIWNEETLSWDSRE